MTAGVTALSLATCLAFGLTVGTAQAQFFPPFGSPQQTQPRPEQPAPKAAPPAPKAQRPAPKAHSAPVAVPYAEVRNACQIEIRSTCAGVVPGSAESVLCLRPNFAVHSPPCQAALTRAGIPSAAPAAASSAPTSPAGTADAPRRISTDKIDAMPDAEPLKDVKLPVLRATQEARFVSRHCAEDHSLLCQGVAFGQSRVLKCLLAHQASLTSECRRAIARR